MTNLAERIEQVDSLMENVKTNHTALNMRKKAIESQIEDLDTNIASNKENERKYLLAVEELKTLANSRSESAKKTIEDTLNWALTQIPLKQRYKAILNDGDSGKNTKEMFITLQDLDTGKLRSIKQQAGTAIPQIISFLMNVIVIKLSGSARIMVLDEVFTGLQDKDSIKMFGTILKSLAEKEHFQFFFIEHKSTLREVEGIKPIFLDLQKYEDGVIQVNSIEDIIPPKASILPIVPLDNMAVVEDLTELSLPERHNLEIKNKEVTSEIESEFDDIDLDDFDM